MHVYCAVYLLDSQGLDGGGLALDGGGLLTHEEAQPLETGLMIHLLSNEPHRVTGFGWGCMWGWARGPTGSPETELGLRLGRLGRGG